MFDSPPEDAVFRPLAVRNREACRLTGIGRSKLYQLIGAGEIEIVEVGAITLIPIYSLQCFLEVRKNGR
jgi:excisionase family DNA binding protein